MRLNRKWLYLGGLVTILTLLLTLTLVLPAGAVGTLDEGSISVDKEYVSPTVESGTDNGLKARTVKISLDNADLTSTQSVRDGGDVGPVTIRVVTAILATGPGSFRVQLNADPVDTGFAITVPSADQGEPDETTLVAMSRILPIVGEVVVDSDTDDDVEDALGTPRVINAKTGLIEFPLLDTIPATSDIILSYNTSKSETALVNVRGEDNFDLLLVEGTAQGEYSETFVVDEPSDVTMNNSVVVHEQHSIDSGLQGYVEFDNETISTFYYDPAGDNTGAHNNARGTLSGAEAYQTALGTLSDSNDEGSDRGIASGQTFYARVANPPIRDGLDVDTEVTLADVRHDAPSDITVLLVDAQQGILSFETTNVFDGFSGGDIEVDYIGSNSFYVTVDHGPINLTGETDIGTIDITDTANAAPSPAAGTITIALPTPDNDTSAPDADDVFDLVSIENDGTNCADCRIRIGVVTAPKDRDDPNPLPSRYSLLAISYSGLERVDIPDGRNDANGTESSDPTSSPNDRDVHYFSRVLAYAPADTMDEEGMQHNIMVVRTTSTPEVDEDNIRVAVTIDNEPRINGRTVWFRMEATDLDSTLEIPAITDNDTFDITYTREVGVLPQNALNPDATVRPVVALANGARVQVASANDSTSSDAETQAPGFSNAMPAHKSGSGSNSELISIDVTDALAGVKKSSIILKVRAGTGAIRTVVNSDLTITDIDDGFRASIALDDVRNGGSGATLNVNASRETSINWYAMAQDNAGNMGTSDSNREKRDEPGANASENQSASKPAGYSDCQRRSAGSDDCYSFSVDGVAPSIQRAYTGDWFNAAESEVQGDRRVSRDNYLPGGSSQTSVRVVFNEAVDGSSVSADDFTVDGTVPQDALWYSSGSTDGADSADTVNGGIRRSVFLTVDQMPSDATPEVVLTGSVSDLAGNSVSSGSKTAQDGIAPGGELSVDTGLNKKTVTVTVVTDEAVRLQSPDLYLWVSDAIDNGFDEQLDEIDTFTVERENKSGPNNATNPLVIRDAGGELAYDGDPTAMANWNLRLSNAPILDRSGGSRTGVVDENDIRVHVYRAETPGTARDDVVTTSGLTDSAKVVRNAKNGDITLRIRGAYTEDRNETPTEVTTDDTAVPALGKGDKILVTYRGTGPDPANQFPTVPDNVRGVPVTDAQNTWTYELDITRDGKYAVTAQMEDSSLNRGEGGVADPMGRGAVVFQIDSELAGDSESDATSTPSDVGTVAYEDPLDIYLHWDDEANEYVGDSNSTVTLTKAELDGEDVSGNAVRQDSNSYIVEIDDVALGRHILTYNAMDEAGNTNARDRTLEFTVTERATWTLRLRKGNNLVSIPANPMNGDINEVFADVPQVQLVYTRQDGLWLTAFRGPDGFSGALTTIDSLHAYWVNATNAVNVELTISPSNQQTVPPSLAVKGGEWVMLPVMSLGSISDDTAGKGAAPGTKIDADAYLGDKFRVALSFERSGYSRIDPDVTVIGSVDHLTNDLPSDPPDPEGVDATDNPLEIGRGYWVLFTEDTFIVPR